MTENFEHYAERCKRLGWTTNGLEIGCDWCNKPASVKIKLFFGLVSTRYLCREHYTKLIREFDRIEKEGGKRK